MKSLKLFLVTAVLLLSSASVFAQSGTTGSLTWSIDNYGTLTISGEGAMPDYTYGTSPWDSESYSIETVVIEEGVTSIGAYAFMGCSSLTSIELPEGITSIGIYAFAYCDELTSIIIPEGVTSIGTYAFYGCDGLTTIAIPEGVTRIEGGVFYVCESLASVTIPESVTSIEEVAFGGCSSLASITIPKGVTSIQGQAFFGCSGLTSILVDADNPSYLSENGVVFNKDKTVLSIYPNGKQGSYTVPESVTTIGDYVFSYYDGLTSITLLEGVTTIGKGAFAYCIGLTSIILPESLQSIGEEAFWGCVGLTSIDIPEDVTSIGSQAFIACSGLTSINIPEGITSIADSVFYGCTSLTSINIPESVTSIGDFAFVGCSGLTFIAIPETVTSIGIGAFGSCNGLSSIIISEDVASIGERAFGYCSGLTSIINLSLTPQEIDANMFQTSYDGSSTVYSNATLYVPAQSLELYRTAEVWQNFARIEPIADAADVSDIEMPEEGITVAPEDSSARIAWNANEDAAGYTLIVYGDADHTQVICSIKLDADGKLQGITFGELRAASAESVFGIRINNLSANTTYHYAMQAFDADNEVLETKQGEFTTLDNSVGIENAEVENMQPVPVAYYSISGQRLPQVPESGLYIVVYDNGTAEKKMILK